MIGLAHVAETAGIDEVAILSFKLGKPAPRRKMINMKANRIAVSITIVAVTAPTTKVCA